MSTGLGRLTNRSPRRGIRCRLRLSIHEVPQPPEHYPKRPFPRGRFTLWDDLRVWWPERSGLAH